MLLRAIPPANRQPLRRLSSMRAATAAGLTMVGGQAKLGSAPTGETFRPKTTNPDPRRQRQKEIYYKAIQSHIRQLKELLATANEPEEAEFWKQQLERIGRLAIGW